MQLAESEQIMVSTPEATQHQDYKRWNSTTASTIATNHKRAGNTNSFLMWLKHSGFDWVCGRLLPSQWFQTCLRFVWHRWIEWGAPREVNKNEFQNLFCNVITLVLGILMWLQRLKNVGFISIRVLSLSSVFWYALWFDAEDPVISYIRFFSSMWLLSHCSETGENL